ncbi:MAG: formylglycine-generating enzyme family protein [Deltaproteobacteria bacterium]|nr:formylglycine-generating enzyme family protein [Deltaproteobacteria bacterium]
MKFVLIPAGSLTMGSRLSPGEVTRRYGGKAEWYKDEQPPHPVEITRPFYLQTTEVSQAQWKRIMGNNPSRFEDCGDDCPVEKVSWNDAQKFIEELNQMEDINKYRLPTEAEWEYACRAKTETAYSFGDEVDKLGEYAWYGDNSGGKTKPVGKKKPNAWGLYDMHGNVWEWVQDRYGDYPTGPIPDPKGPDKGEYRV